MRFIVCITPRCTYICARVLCKAAAACIKARAVGLLLAFFRPPDACHSSKKKKGHGQGGEEGRRTKRRERKAQGGVRGGAV